MNKKVIYTSLTGYYDSLPQYDVIDSSFDYICFSNDYPAGSKIGQWVIRSIPYNNSNQTILSRYAKILPHKVLSDYEWSVWLDSNIQIKDQSIYQRIDDCIKRGCVWNGIVHPKLNSIYEDIEEALRRGIINYKDGVKQKKFLVSNSYPRNLGLFENNFIIRKHNDSKVTSISSSWWYYFTNFVARDQFSLFLVFWQQNFIPDLILERNLNTRNIESLEVLPHNRLSLYKRILKKVRIYKNLLLMKFNNDLSY